MKPYSNDLRTRIVEAYDNQKGSIRQLAERFAIDFSTVWRLLVHYRHTGKVDPKPHGGGQPPKIDETGLEQLRHLVVETSDATVVELQQRFEQTAHITTSRAAVGRALLKLKLSRKKKQSAPPNKTRIRSKRDGKNTRLR